MALKAGDLVLIWSQKKDTSYILKIQPGGRFSTHLGNVMHDEIIGKEYGDSVVTNTSDRYYLLTPTLGEFNRRIKRQTQVIFPKEAGYIIMHLNIFPGARVVECGSGSGGLTCTLAHFVGEAGKVYSYERREEFSKLARASAERWGVAERVEFKVKDIAEGFDEKGVDALFLDVKTPWDYLAQAAECLSPGHQLGVLVPTYNQIDELVQHLPDHGFVNIEVLEILLRGIKPMPGRIRPTDTMVGHTGFLIFSTLIRKTEDTPDKPKAEQEDETNREE